MYVLFATGAPPAPILSPLLCSQQNAPLQSLRLTTAYPILHLIPFNSPPPPCHPNCKNMRTIIQLQKTSAALQPAVSFAIGVYALESETPSHPYARRMQHGFSSTVHPAYLCLCVSSALDTECSCAPAVAWFIGKTLYQYPPAPTCYHHHIMRNLWTTAICCRPTNSPRYVRFSERTPEVLLCQLIVSTTCGVNSNVFLQHR